jgi:hypothetical protein
MLSLPRTTWILAAIITTLSPLHSVRRWGADGHRIVAAIALHRLSPDVANETRRLLGGQEITDIASWPDEARRELPNTAPWHYIDIEITDSSYQPARDCKANACVIWALESETARLGDRSLPDSVRAVALKWVVHLVGDIHQPLHAGERGDKGGNDVKGITFDGRNTNLHSLWDSGLLHSFGQSDDAIVGQLLDEIGRRSDIAAISGGTVEQWAMESHDIARDVVYHNLPNSLEIGPPYVAAARPVIYERLLRAGVRLGALLERTLGRESR